MFSRDKEEDKRALEAAENTLRHMKDMEKQIDARESVVHEQMAPYKTRLARNHFMQEYEELFRGNK